MVDILKNILSCNNSPVCQEEWGNFEYNTFSFVYKYIISNDSSKNGQFPLEALPTSTNEKLRTDDQGQGDTEKLGLTSLLDSRERERSELPTNMGRLSFLFVMIGSSNESRCYQAWEEEKIPSNQSGGRWRRTGSGTWKEHKRGLGLEGLRRMTPGFTTPITSPSNWAPSSIPTVPNCEFQMKSHSKVPLSTN